MAPIVPGDPQLLPTDVPAVYAPHPGTFGEAGRGLSDIGATVQNISMGLDDQLKKSEAIDASDKAMFQDTIDSEDKMQQLKMSYKSGFVTDSQGNQVQNPDGTPRTITQEYRDWANGRYQQNQTAMPNLMAQQLYKEKAGRYFTSSMLKVRDDELQQRVSNFHDGYASRALTVENRLVDMPNPNAAYNYTDSLLSSAKDQVGHVLSPAEFDTLQKATQQKSADALFKGLETSVLREPKRGQTRSSQIDYVMSVLQGQDPDSQRRKNNGLYTFSDVVNPDEKAKIEQRLLALRQQAGKMDTASLNQQTENAKSLLDMGQRVDVTPQINGWRQLRAQNQIDDEQYAEKVGGLYAHDAAYKAFTNPAFKMMSPDEKQKYIAQAGDQLFQQYAKQLPPDLASPTSTVGGVYRKEFHDELTRLGNQYDKRAVTDFASTLNDIPQVKALTANLDFSAPQTFWKTGAMLKQRSDVLEQMGDAYFKTKSPDFRYFSKDESQKWSNALKNPTTPAAQVVNGLEAAQAGDSKRFGSYIDQMIRDKNLDQGWRFVLGAPDTQTRVDIVSALRDGKTIREEAGKIMKDKGQSWEGLDKAVGQKAADFLTGDFQGVGDSSTGLQQIKAVRDAITNKAAKLYAADHGSKPDLGSYAQQAVDAMYGTQYKSVNTGGGALWWYTPGSQNQINIPKTVDGRPLADQEFDNVVKNRADLLSANDKLKANGVIVPQGMNGIEPDKFYDQVRTTGRIVPSGDRQGFYLLYKDPTTGGYVHALTEQKDRNGNNAPFYMKLTDLIKDPPKPEKTGSSFLDSILNMGTTLKKSF